MRPTVLAALAAMLLVAVLPLASADVSIPAPQLSTFEGRVTLSVYWCPVVETDGGPEPCGPREEIVALDAGALAVQPVCVDRVVDETACALLTPSVGFDDDGVVVGHPLLP